VTASRPFIAGSLGLLDEFIAATTLAVTNVAAYLIEVR